MSTPSPEMSQYQDLRVFDKDPQDIFDAAIQSLRLRMPGWMPREDATEVVLMEALALEVAESSFAINRLPSSIMMSLLSLFGIARHEGSFPTTAITLTVNTQNVSIEAGAQFSLTTPYYDEPVIFTTTETAYFTNATVVDVPAQANVLTNDLYTVPVGTQLYALGTNSYLESARIGSSIIGGSNPETDKEWLDRAVSHFRRLVSTLVTPEHFRLAALDYEVVTRAKVLDLYDPSATTPEVGTAPGHVTVALYGQNRLLTDQEKAFIHGELRTRALASLQVHVIDSAIVPIPVEAVIGYSPNVTQSDVDNRIQQALTEMLSASSWDWATKVRRNEIIAAISAVQGVDFVDRLITPATDVDLQTSIDLAQIGEVTLHNYATWTGV
jgi:uncharacterized phage protein gp47/JayE